MKVAAIVLFVLAGLTALIAIKNVVTNRPGDAPHLIGYVVGSFLVPLIFLIIGLVLHKKSKQQ